MKDPGGAEHAFEDLRGEAMRFLQDRATSYPELAHVIRLLRAEIGRAVLPDPLPAPGLTTAHS